MRHAKLVKQLVAVALVGAVAGIVGGMVGFRLSERGNRVQKSSGILRAKEFEVIGSNGVVHARIGVDSGDYPYIALYAGSGSERLRMALDNVDEPFISMRDTKNDLRARFGHEPSDTAKSYRRRVVAIFSSGGARQRCGGDRDDQVLFVSQI